MSYIAQRTKQAFELYNGGYTNEAYLQIFALVKQGVDVNKTDNHKRTLLHWAAVYQHLDVCKLLIHKSANIDARAHSTPLHLAVQNNRIESMELLLQYGADICVRDKWGNALLHEAVVQKNSKALQFLLGQGANIWANNNNDITVLFFDEADVIESQLKLWMPKLEKVKDGKFEGINTSQDLYHLASVMKPINPKDIPHPKEFIRLLFQQYLPHEEKFNAMYEEIFSQQRVKPLDLQSARKEAAKGRGVVL